MGVDNFSDQDKPTSEGPDNTTGQQAGASRRNFTRRAVAGSAVFLSLGNRAAWGAVTDPANQCLSVNHYLSYNPAGGNFGIASVHPENVTPNGTSKDDIARAIDTYGIDEESPTGYYCPNTPEATSTSLFDGPLTQDGITGD